MMEHPGLQLAEKLKRTGIKQVWLAEQIGAAPSQLNEILKGKRPFSAAMCVRLQEILHVGLNLWKDQAQYEWEQARQKTITTEKP